jgi:hypothetical protein
MKDDYLIKHLKRFAEALNPNMECFSFKKGGMFWFGVLGDGKINKVTKQVAIYLCIGIYIPDVKKKKRIRRRRRK